MTTVCHDYFQRLNVKQNQMQTHKHSHMEAFIYISVYLSVCPSVYLCCIPMSVCLPLSVLWEFKDLDSTDTGNIMFADLAYLCSALFPLRSFLYIIHTLFRTLSLGWLPTIFSSLVKPCHFGVPSEFPITSTLYVLHGTCIHIFLMYSAEVYISLYVCIYIYI